MIIFTFSQIVVFVTERDFIIFLDIFIITIDVALRDGNCDTFFENMTFQNFKNAYVTFPK